MNEVLNCWGLLEVTTPTCTHSVQKEFRQLTKGFRSQVTGHEKHQAWQGEARGSPGCGETAAGTLGLPWNGTYPQRASPYHTEAEAVSTRSLQMPRSQKPGPRLGHAFPGPCTHASPGVRASRGKTPAVQPAEAPRAVW